MHPFEDVPGGQLERLNSLQARLAADSSPKKVNLMYGVYRPADGAPQVLPAVEQAKQRLFEDKTWNHEYPPSHLGTPDFRVVSANLMFGHNHPLLVSKRVVTMQTLGASGACHMGALFLKHHYGPWKNGNSAQVFIPKESWTNHPNLFSFLGIEALPLPYYDPAGQALAFATFNATIAALPKSSVIVLQSSSQNPTGCDPSVEQWRKLAETFKESGHFAFFDAAYLGFVSGDVFTDAESIRIFADAGVPLLLAATYGKAFGLYGERVGFLAVVAPNARVGMKIETQMKLLARAETGAMPAFGARIVEMILKDAGLRKVWEEDVRTIAKDLQDRRANLRRLLEAKGTPGKWNHLTEQVGMFSFMAVSDEQIEMLRERHHVFVQENGRISIAGLNSSNMEYIVDSLNAVMRSTEN